VPVLGALPRVRNGVAGATGVDLALAHHDVDGTRGRPRVGVRRLAQQLDRVDVGRAEVAAVQQRVAGDGERRDGVRVTLDHVEVVLFGDQRVRTEGDVNVAVGGLQLSREELAGARGGLRPVRLDRHASDRGVGAGHATPGGDVALVDVE